MAHWSRMRAEKLVGDTWGYISENVIRQVEAALNEAIERGRNGEQPLRERIARAMCASVERENGSAEGRKLLGYASSADFVEAAWRNYLKQADAAIAAMEGEGD